MKWGAAGSLDEESFHMSHCCHPQPKSNKWFPSDHDHKEEDLAVAQVVELDLHLEEVEEDHHDKVHALHLQAESSAK